MDWMVFFIGRRDVQMKQMYFYYIWNECNANISTFVMYQFHQIHEPQNTKKNLPPLYGQNVANIASISKIHFTSFKLLPYKSNIKRKLLSSTSFRLTIGSKSPFHPTPQHIPNQPAFVLV